MDFQKAVTTVGAAVVGVFLAFGIDVSSTVEVVGAAVLIITPIVVYVVQNDAVTSELANKAVVALGPAVVGVAALAGVDVSKEVEQLTGAALSLTPLLVFFTAND